MRDWLFADKIAITFLYKSSNNGWCILKDPFFYKVKLACFIYPEKRNVAYFSENYIHEWNYLIKLLLDMSLLYIYILNVFKYGYILNLTKMHV